MVTPSYSLDELRKISNGDNQFLKDMVVLFISQTEASLREIDAGMAAREFQKVFSALHKMKPSIQVMGVDSVISVIQQTEEMKATTVDEEVLKRHIGSIREKLTRVITELKG
jgi:HPt (histidine-containing phosphotransfer) domain-containing protein